MIKLNFANRRTKNENEVTKELENLLRKNNSSEILNSPFNYLPRQTVTSMLTRIDLFRMIENINGSIVECGPKEQILKTPYHPYTQALLHSIPQISEEKIVIANYLKGEIPDLRYKFYG